MAFKIFGQIRGLNVPPADQMRFFVLDTLADLSDVGPLMQQGELAYVLSDDSKWRMKAGSVLASENGGGGGSTISGVEVVVDFGLSLSTDSSAIVTGQSWVASGTKFMITLTGTTVDHPDPIEGILEQLVYSISDVVPGVGFTLNAHAPLSSYGQYRFNVIGV